MHRFALLGAFALACHSAPRHGTAGAVEYRNGVWYDGEKFQPRSMWVIGNRFATSQPARVDSVVDLHGGFVVPPYGEAHNHWLEPALVDTYINVHLRAGIFYVKDQSTAPAFHDAIRARVNLPASVDYTAAHQGFTGPGGHPLELIAGLAQMKILPAAWRDSHGEGEAVFVVATDAEIDRAWPKLLAGHPDFVKLFLVHSDEYAARRDDASLPPSKRGLDPALVPGIVRRAHAAKLRVSAHIENAADFHVAVEAGADDIAHLPFVVEPDKLDSYRLDDGDIAALAKRHGTIATTLDWAADATPEDPRVGAEKDNIDRLRSAGVTIVIGTDRFRETAATEVALIAKLQLMTNGELLHAWTYDTPRAIFPDRDLARFVDDAEASFLVLSGDPLADIAHTKDITIRVKQGVTLEPTAAQMPPLGP